MLDKLFHKLVSWKERVQLTKQPSFLGKGSHQVNGLPYFQFQELAGITLMQWEHTRPTSRSPAGRELGKAGSSVGWKVLLICFK